MLLKDDHENESASKVKYVSRATVDSVKGKRV
jgi:hypothetical protein